ncbi:MAG: hypothetical protein QY326_03955 [Bdellovibrionota bacterium]|nr:MAG: hypothetical protein QY326_03955 [Bdellovibrionota bacterium]
MFSAFVRENAASFVVSQQRRGATTSEYVTCTHNPPVGPRVLGAQFSVQDGVGQIRLETSEGNMVFDLPKVGDLGIASDRLMQTIKDILEGRDVAARSQATQQLPATGSLHNATAALLLSTASMPAHRLLPAADPESASERPATTALAIYTGPRPPPPSTALALYHSEPADTTPGGLARRSAGGAITPARTETANEIISEIMCVLSSVGYLRNIEVRDMNIVDQSWAGLDMKGAKLSNLSFVDRPGGVRASLVATNLSNCVTEGVVEFREVAAERMNMQNLRNVGQRLVFDHCDLRGANFKNAEFAVNATQITDRFAMRGCDIRGADFAGCRTLQDFLLNAPDAEVLRVFKGSVYDPSTVFSADKAVDAKIKERLDKMSGGIQSPNGEMTAARVISHLQNSPMADTLTVRFGAGAVTVVPLGPGLCAMSEQAGGNVRVHVRTPGGPNVNQTVGAVAAADFVAGMASTEATNRRRTAA